MDSMVVGYSPTLKIDMKYVRHELLSVSIDYWRLMDNYIDLLRCILVSPKSVHSSGRVIKRNLLKSSLLGLGIKKSAHYFLSDV